MLSDGTVQDTQASQRVMKSDEESKIGKRDRVEGGRICWEDEHGNMYNVAGYTIGVTGMVCLAEDGVFGIGRARNDLFSVNGKVYGTSL